MTDRERTPAQIADDEAREARQIIADIRALGLITEFIAHDATTAIDRALLAARWAQAVDDHERSYAMGCPHCADSFNRDCEQIDRLRREWEEASK